MRIRAGSYSYDLFEQSIGRNLYRIDPDIPPLAAGGTMAFYPGAPMTVAVADPPHALVLWQVTSQGKAIDPAGPWGDDYVAWSWAFVLEPVDAFDPAAGPDAGELSAGAKWAPTMWLLVEPAHFVMGRRQLLGIRQRAEAARPPGHQQRTGPPAVGVAEAAVGVKGGHLTRAQGPGSSVGGVGARDRHHLRRQAAVTFGVDTEAAATEHRGVEGV